MPLHLDLPPLGPLLAFEAAGRLLSFKQAATELHVTPSAVSQQIRSLEEHLGLELFERRPRAIALTAVGQRYLVGVRAALFELARATRRTKQAAGSTIRLSMTPFVAYELVLPRMDEYRRAQPSVELRVEARMGLADFYAGEVDAALRLGAGHWEGLHATRLGPVFTTPVCCKQFGPQLAAGEEARLITVRAQSAGTVQLARRCGVNFREEEVLSFESYFEVMRAVENGAGVTAGLFPLTSPWISAGRVVAPRAETETMADAMYLVHRLGEGDRPGMPELHQWLSDIYTALPSIEDARSGEA